MIQNIISQLQSVTVQSYSLFFIINDFIYMQRLLSETEHYTLWLDYSQNNNFAEKRQVQSAHFSERQHTSTTQFYKHPKMEKIHIFTTCQMTQTVIKDIIHC